MTSRVLKIALTVSVCGASVFWPSCAFGTSTTGMSDNQTAVVQRGDLAIAVTASANLALSNKKDLAFGMAGYVEQVSVKEGDTVKEGQVLANLNTTDDWEAQITTLERQLTAAQRKVTAAERNVTTAQRKVTTAERQLADAQKQLPAQVSAKQRALLQAEMEAKNAEIALAKARGVYRSPEIDILKSDMKVAQANLEYDMDNLLSGEGSRVIWQRQVQRDAAALDSLRAKLNAALPIADDDGILLREKQLEIAQASLKGAQDAVPQAEEDTLRAVGDAQLVVQDCQAAVEDARAALEDARTAVQDAQKGLDKARNASPLIEAPFDGFVTAVSVKGGDEVQKGTIAVQVADPTKFEASVLVSEKDFLQVKLGGDASVRINAVPTLSYLAKVIYIAPTATVQQGVANYKVKVELQSPQPVSQNQSTLSPGSQSTPGWKPTPTATQAIQLKEGMSIMVNILIQQRNNVLLIPNQAVITQGRETVVTVSQNGTSEVRPIRTGISDRQYTEVTDGLTEGEQVIIPKSAASTPRAGQGTQQPRGNLVR